MAIMMVEMTTTKKIIVSTLSFDLTDAVVILFFPHLCEYIATEQAC